MMAMGPKGAKYRPAVDKGAKKVASVAVDKGIDWNQKRGKFSQRGSPLPPFS
jgi:hypothetical protein